MPEEYAEVRRRIPDHEKITVGGYIFGIRPLEDCTFKRADGRFYTVKEQGMDWKIGPFIITTKGNKMNLQDCMRDTEMNLSEIVNNERNRI